MSELDAVRLGAQIEALVQKLSAVSDSPAKAQAQELVRLLMALYGAGVSQMLDIIRTERAGPEAVLERLATDPLVASLLILHDLHPYSVELRVQRALAALSSHLPAPTTLRLVAVEGDAVRVAITGTGHSQTSATVRAAIERAVHEAAPELATIHIDGLDEPLIQIIRSSPSPSAAAP